jgi:TRAP-type C4-dicarboxylate transport system permease small subunit
MPHDEDGDTKDKDAEAKAADEAEDRAEAASDEAEKDAEDAKEAATAKEEAEEEEPPAPPASIHPPLPDLPRHAWGLPLVRLDKAWTKLEMRLCAAVLMGEIFALCLWISMKGLSAEYGGGDRSGLVFRALVGAVVLGYAVHRVTRPKPGVEEDPKAAQTHAIAVTVAVAVGILGAWGWANRGTVYFSNFLNWMQSASFLTLVGGLRGVATRLTLWLALLGGSLATAQGKHINIDVVMRFLTPRLRVPAAVLGWLAAAAMCFAGVWGFFDHIAIESFKSPATEPCPDDAMKSCDVSPGKKFAHVKEEIGRDLFLAGRQMALDLKSFPKVVGGTKYNEWLRAKEWNEWMSDLSWKEHYPAEAVDALRMDETLSEATHQPVISIPGSAENVPGLLIKDLNFIFPFGLFMIGMRFLLRCLLAISGHVRVDPDAVHGEEEVEEAQIEKHGGPPDGAKIVTAPLKTSTLETSGTGASS